MYSENNKSEILSTVLNWLQENKKDDKRLMIAIDGSCASGKSTFAHDLAKEIHGQVVHLDDFYLQEHQRTKERYQTPGENLDHERLLHDVMIPCSCGKETTYQIFDCTLMALTDSLKLNTRDPIIFEGSYALHPDLRSFYDLVIVLTIDEAEQLRRLEERESEKSVKEFKERWIPLENQYQEHFHIEDLADLVF